ncbi:hypothetical protein N0V90_001069 [Kalmusia sp. IMI 367209]|nr:hypothetical protein N0V90_001069 [Kalmusia sp. IMI 367209]
MSEVDSKYVKQGFWINTYQDQPMGSTITTDSQTGAIILALLAILSSLATTHLWSLVLFVNHQLRAHDRPADVLYRQQQALLRTNPPPTAFLVDWTKLYWAWRKRTSRVFYRSIAQLLLAIGFATLSILAGIFSSYVLTSISVPVLVKSSLCGPLNIEPTVSGFGWAYLDDLDSYTDLVDTRSIAFAQECFRNSTKLPLRCGAFIQPRINLEPKLEKCPFDGSMCIQRHYPAVSIDSGLINTNDYFGWNMQKEDNVKYRRKVTCGILNTQGRTAIVNASDYPFHNRNPVPGEEFYQVSFGEVRNGGAFANVTFSHSSADELASLPGTVKSENFPGASDIQLAAVQLLVTSSFQYDTATAAAVVFQAQDLAERSGGQILELPDDQWIQEILGWEKYIWASMQTMVSDYAIGYGAQTPLVQSYVRTNLTQGERQLCGVQRMVKSGGFVNINVFGLSFIIGFASLVTILNLVMLKLFMFFSRFRRALAPRIDRWIQDGVFQLQRRAYEGSQQGTWKLLNSEIPVTVTQELLHELPLETRCPKCSGAGERHVVGHAELELEPILSQNTEVTAVERTDDGTERDTISHEEVRQGVDME